MAIDVLIIVLLLVSFLINLIAIAAFRITPGLQSIANRFVINLLIVNLIGCMILAPTLFYNFSIYESKEVDSSLSKATITTIFQANHKLLEEDDFLQSNIQIRDNQITQNTTKIIIKSSESFNASSTELYEEQKEQDEIIQMTKSSSMKRSWTIDLSAALGALSVLLVVGDTWCAVTDPLRYHSRISNVRSWILISMIWVVGTLTGLLSAFRGATFTKETSIELKFDDRNISKHFERDLENIETMTMFQVEDDFYNIIYSVAYFMLIILIPFGFICGMYWRIISEVRGNGMRMRQNGSSPLLQSSVNLGNHHHIHQLNYYQNDIIINISMSLNKSSSTTNFNDVLKSGMRQVNSSPNMQLISCEHSPQHHMLQIPSQSLPLPSSKNKSPNSSSGGISYISSLRHRLSNASSLFKYREETRAARISSLVIIFYLITYIPYGILVLLQGHFNDFIYSKQLTIFLITLTYISGPFIFAYRKKRVRRGIRRMFWLKTKPNNIIVNNNSISRHVICSSNNGNNLPVMV